MAFAKMELSLIGKISNNALIIYTLMQNRGEYDELIKSNVIRYKVDTIAKMSNVSRRTCVSCLNELEEVGLLLRSRTGRASYYIVMPPEAIGKLQRARKDDYIEIIS